MVTSGKNIHANILWIKAVFLLPFISLVAGICNPNTKDDNGLYKVKCTCYNPNEDLEVTPELSTIFINASSLEISQCRMVVMHPNLFRRSYDLISISISQLDELSFDPALSFPVYLRTLSLSAIRSLDHFPAPGPSSALLHSVKSLDLLSIEDVTVTTPPSTSTSSFIDLPITKVHMNRVKFVGTIPRGILNFNASSLVHFSAIQCQFSEMVEGSFYVHASGNVTIDNCKFESMMQESMKVYGQRISFSNNMFHNLGGTHSIFILGHQHVSIMKNTFKALGAPHALLLDANKNALVYIKDNQLPCGCYASNFIPTASNKISQSTCKADDSLACALKQRQHCFHANGKNETIEISSPELPSCPSVESQSASGSVEHDQAVDKITLIALYFSFFMIIHVV